MFWYCKKNKVKVNKYSRYFFSLGEFFPVNPNIFIFSQWVMIWIGLFFFPPWFTVLDYYTVSLYFSNFSYAYSPIFWIPCWSPWLTATSWIFYANSKIQFVTMSHGHKQGKNYGRNLRIFDKKCTIFGSTAKEISLTTKSVQSILKLKIKIWFHFRWNQLDIGIVFLSILGIILEELKREIIPINPTIIRVMRVLRIARVLKLLKMARGIRALLDTVMQALPQVVAIKLSSSSSSSSLKSSEAS